MSGYVVHAPMPLGAPPGLGPTARVYLFGLDATGHGELRVDSEDPRFAEAVKARLQRCYGFRGRPIGERITQDDLHCAMCLATMRPLRPARLG